MDRTLKCSTCLNIMEASYFYKDISIKRGYSYKCKSCRKNKELSKKPVVFLNDIKYCSRCSNYKPLDNFSFCKDCPNNLRTYCKSCENSIYLSNKDILAIKSKEYRTINRDILLKKKKEYHSKNKSKRRDYLKNRLKTDTTFSFKTAVIKNINSKLRRNLLGCKERKTLDILGCSIEEFKQYIESKFEHWMTWENRGKYNGELNYGWDLDHIVPLFYAKNDKEVYELNHYTNFQPLCSKINRDIKWRNNQY